MRTRGLHPSPAVYPTQPGAPNPVPSDRARTHGPFGPGSRQRRRPEWWVEAPARAPRQSARKYPGARDTSAVRNRLEAIRRICTAGSAGSHRRPLRRDRQGPPQGYSGRDPGIADGQPETQRERSLAPRRQRLGAPPLSQKQPPPARPPAPRTNRRAVGQGTG